jgi:Fe2+ transport system protein B
MMAIKSNMDKVLERIEALSELVHKSSYSDEEFQRINLAIQNLQLSINDIIEKKVNSAINTQQRLCQVHFERILEKVEEVRSSLKEHKSDDKKAKEEKEEKAKSWKDRLYNGITGTFFGAFGSLIFIFFLWALDHYFKLGLSLYLNAPSP